MICHHVCFSLRQWLTKWDPQRSSITPEWLRNASSHSSLGISVTNLSGAWTHLRTIVVRYSCHHDLHFLWIVYVTCFQVSMIFITGEWIDGKRFSSRLALSLGMLDLGTPPPCCTEACMEKLHTDFSAHSSCQGPRQQSIPEWGRLQADPSPATADGKHTANLSMNHPASPDRASEP